MIFLRKMTEPEFETYLSLAIPKYAHQKAKGEGISGAEAEKISLHSFKSLLPEGLHSKGQHLFSIIENSTKEVVGTLWFAEKISETRRQAYIYDIEIDEKFRGRGFGKKALELFEKEARSLDLNSLGLHVFGYNTVARSLYEKVGYKPTNIVMVKELT